MVNNVMNGLEACLGTTGLLGFLGGYVNLYSTLAVTNSTFSSTPCSVLHRDPRLLHPIMPVYELFCLARPQISQQSLAAVIKTAANVVLTNAGVMTDVTSYGHRDLAYPIRKAGSKYTEVRTAS